ncbi:hypothetical protein [Nocardioides sp.]|uniref:hypothetical protein n=1 Tax=Nocardioides sp. TaxID=35761 RepID=UPI002ED0E1A5
MFTFAAASTGTDLWTAVHDAKADLIGVAAHPPRSRCRRPRSSRKKPGSTVTTGSMYPDGLSRFAELDVVAVPAMAAAEGLVYDRSGCFLVVADDSRITPSRDYAPAYERDSATARTRGRCLREVSGCGWSDERMPWAWWPVPGTMERYCPLVTISK